jgi:hypothetical protein
MLLLSFPAISFANRIDVAGGGGSSLSADSVNDTHIDWGTGANQVDTDDVPQGSTNLFSPFTDSGTTTYLTTTTDDVVIGGTSVLNSGKVSIDGDADQTQVTIQGNSTQTADIFTIEKSDGTDVFHVEGDGKTHIEHTATENDVRSFKIDTNVAGFGDVKAIDVTYVTGAISAGEDEEAILVNIDETLSGGGDVVGLEVVTTAEGSASIYGTRFGVTVNPIVQLSGAFANMDSALVNATDRLTEFTSTGSDITMFVADNDTVTIGDAATYQEIEVVLDTAASGAGIKPTFEYSTGVGTWATFSPSDGTNGMRNTGVITWLLADIPSWAVDGNSEYAIRITRTANALATSPIEDIVQISSATKYSWDKTGALDVKSVNKVTFTAPATSATITATDGTTTTLSGGTHSGTNTGDNDEVGTKTSGDICTNDGSVVNCTINTFAEMSTALDNQADVVASFVITNGNTAIDATVTDPVVCTSRIPNNLKITAWYIDCDQSGSIVLDVWKNTWNDTPLVNADSIAGTEKPTLSADVSASDVSLTSMTADWDAGQQVCIEIESAATVTKCSLDFYGYPD